MKQITIDDLIPLLRTGWIAMDEDKSWHWHKTKPVICQWEHGCYWYSKRCYPLDSSPDKIFNIAPAKDWEQSLRRVK